ncbi:MAG TPA: SPOR domain-containing protein [Hyphomicrobiaceae bacterium]|nr:SPOR domain-containing protein [Hyphomicrobiaceae bacterium]
MTRDWRKVALAVLAAVALAAVCAIGSRVEAQQTAKAAKAPAKAAPPEAKKDDAEDGEEEPAKTPVAAKKKKQDPVEAQRAVDAAAKLLQSGKTEQAAQALTATLAGGNLPPAIMARALYMRGVAYRQQSKPAQAISDLTSALWLKGGLTAEDRQDALKQRSGAYADAGLTESGEAAATTAVAAATAPATKEAKERPASKSWGVVTTPADNAPANTTQTAEGGGNWFKNWFNNSSPAQAKGPPSTASIDKAEAPPRTPQPAATPRVASAWSSKTQVQPETPAAETRAPTVRPAAATAVGKYRVQLATVRTQQEAAALAAKAKRSLGALAAREPEIDQTVLGNMGSFYRVLVGPFATVQETQAVCAKAKGTGFDCLTVTQ